MEQIVEQLKYMNDVLTVIAVALVLAYRLAPKTFKLRT